MTRRIATRPAPAPAAGARCAVCSYPLPADAASCPQCGELCGELRGGSARARAAPTAPDHVTIGFRGTGTAPPASEPLPPMAPRPLGLPEPWFYLLLGAALAPLFLLPVLRYAGWFFGSLCHELGHTVVAWAFGMPAFPAIRIDGHAASIHQEQKLLLVFAAFAGLLALAWWLRERRAALVAILVAAVAYLPLAFTGGRELLHLAGGHLGELAFATIAFERALTGGFTSSGIERTLNAQVAAFLVGRNLWLCGGLLWHEDTRLWYEASGSFGMVNDYLRIANDVVGCSLGAVAGVMLVVALLPLPLAVLVRWLRSA